MGAPTRYDRIVIASFLFNLAPWRDEARCADDTDPDRWFPDSDDEERISALQAICVECPVRVQCAKYCLESKVRDGVWAGFLIDPDHIAKSRGNVARWLRSVAPVDQVYRGR